MSEGREKRGAYRVTVSWKAAIKAKKFESPERAIVQNVSLSGIYFITQLILEVKDRIVVESDLEYAGCKHDLVVECEVMRNIMDIKTGVHGYGVRFIALGKSNLQFLLPLLADLWIRQGGKVQANESESASK